SPLRRLPSRCHSRGVTANVLRMRPDEGFTRPTQGPKSKAQGPTRPIGARLSQTDPLARLWYAETMLDEQVTDTTFEAHRGRLFGLAYRMLGSRAEAEDV